MIDLQLSCGLPLLFDEMAEKFIYGQGIACRAINKIPLSSLLPGLLNKSLRYPQYVYLEHKNIHLKEDDQIFENNDMNFDILMLPSGLMGVEFIRSHIFYSCIAEGDRAGLSEVVEVLSGSLTVLLQKNKPKTDLDYETRVSEGLVVKLEKAEKFAIPRGYYYTFINTKELPVVFSRFYLHGNVCDYSQLKREQGLAYFAIRKNAKQEIVLNPRYREVPNIQKSKADQVERTCNKPTISSEPLYHQLVNNSTDLLSWF